VFDTYDAWIAHYNVQVPRFEYSHGMWQYSCSGTVPGINADVDLNYAYYDYPQIMKDMKLNGFE
jgi:GH25 family lysozyme M1 (1,4-beta-N-acetylmuramidase)